MSHEMQSRYSFALSPVLLREVAAAAESAVLKEPPASPLLGALREELDAMIRKEADKIVESATQAPSAFTAISPDCFSEAISVVKTAEADPALGHVGLSIIFIFLRCEKSHLCSHQMLENFTSGLKVALDSTSGTPSVCPDSIASVCALIERAERAPRSEALPVLLVAVKVSHAVAL